MVEFCPIEVTSSKSEHLFEILALHRANARDLGFFPEGAFSEHHERGQIIVAHTRSREFLGYLLYRISKGRASIVHLCVHELAKRRGVAKKLVEELKARTTSLQGIGLYCRRDYAAVAMWPRFGFEAVNSKTGRGKDCAELTFWWFSHNHEDLFSRVAQSEPLRQKVVIDANVFYDLHFRETLESEDSKALVADWVQSSIELVATKELRNEINRCKDERDRRASLAEASRYPVLTCDDQNFQRICSELRSIFPAPGNIHDEADRRQIAYAISGGAQFMVTRDEALANRCEGLYERFGLTVAHPAVLISHLDALERAGDYEPARIEGSRISIALLKPERLGEMIEAFRRPNEKVSDFKKRVLRCLGRPETLETQVVCDAEGYPVILGANDRGAEGVIDIPLLRGASHPLAITLIRNFVHTCLRCAADEDRSLVKITDAPLAPRIEDVLTEFGFQNCGGVWSKIALHSVGNLEEIRASLQDRPDCDLGYRVNPVLDSIFHAEQLDTAEAFAAIERQLWPAKVVGDKIPSFIVPIQPRWACHFFDADLGSQLLFGLRNDLHLGVEGVYYRKSKNNNLVAPGRILWYVSQGKGEGSMTVKACSQLEEVAVGNPKELYRKFRRLGVYEWSDVFAASGHREDNEMVAFRFAMTERFKIPVGMDFIERQGIRPPFMSPRRISDSQFAAIYRKGCALA